MYWYMYLGTGPSRWQTEKCITCKPGIQRTRKFLKEPGNIIQLLLASVLCHFYDPHHGTTMCPDNHQHDTQTPYKPPYLFSVYVPFVMKLLAGPRIPETRENRLSAHDIGRPRPPRGLLSQRKVTAAWSKLEVVHFRRFEMLLWCNHGSVVW